MCGRVTLVPADDPAIADVDRARDQDVRDVNKEQWWLSACFHCL